MGAEHPSSNIFWTGLIHNSAFAEGGEREGTFLSIDEECPSSKLPFLFFQNFHIHWLEKQIIILHTKLGVV